MPSRRNSTPSYLLHGQSGRARAVWTDALGIRHQKLLAEWDARLTEQQKKELAAWRKAHRWHPNQLRHSYATTARKLFSLEHAGAALGHSRMSATEVYAERDAGLAVEVAAKIG